MAIIAGLVAGHAPANTRLAIHWNDMGAPDGFAKPWTALFIPVALCAGLSLVFALLGRLLAPMPDLIHGVLLFMVVYEAMIAAPIFGVDIPQNLSPLMAVVGLFYILMGNDMPKLRPVAHRPQTLPEINRTIASKRFGSRFWIVAGVAILVAALLPLEPAARHILTKVAAWFAILPPLLYSISWRQN